MSEDKNKIEKRRYPRAERNLPIKIKNEDFDIVTETKNISCTGTYCQVDRYIPPFTKIKATILLPSKMKNNSSYINCEGVVVRVEKKGNNLEIQYNIAVYFNEISKINMLKIDRFVKSQPTL
ncbi:MAG: PilZ domain-containing protein [Candidatus Omnitrophica bacterium]|nr:PilZ domain-containing protein [Candidatus Omnitrophota bacterium]MDD5352280.1 PilZ domain-containing protein [Candidatus Omnitrophota bacterium]MDD5549878.1 PilZ domain-containing protein [Candidatus Omnitrophota bacterium]